MWQQGDMAGAVALEAAWNQLRRKAGLPLLCAYPVAALGSVDRLAAVRAVCRSHDEVVAPRHYADGHLSGGEPVTPPCRAATIEPHCCVLTATASSAVRRSVAQALVAWGASPDLVAGAAVVVAELATNAIVHARSPFDVTLQAGDRTLRIEVTDAGDGAPSMRRRDPASLGGRGLELVAALSDRWGVAPTIQGKVMWAELALAGADQHLTPAGDGLAVRPASQRSPAGPAVGPLGAHPGPGRDQCRGPGDDESHRSPGT